MTRARALLPVLALALVVLSGGEASANPDAPRLPIGDSILAVARNRHVTVRLGDGGERRGVVADYDPTQLVLIEDETGRIASIPRADVIGIRVLDAVSAGSMRPPPTTPSTLPLFPTPRPTKVRHIGLQASTGPGNVLLDAEYGHFYGFLGTSIGYPIIFAGGGINQYFAATAGAGGTWKLSSTSNWRFNLMGTLTPTLWDGISVGIGVAVGFHYTSPGGFTVGFKIPLFGVAPGCNAVFGDDNGNGCPNVSGGASLIASYYLQAAMSLPVVSVGYRF